MPTDLTPAEKDDRQIERLIDKKPAPSRKPAGRGAPKHDNRRRRMKDTSEKREDDKDLSRETKASLFAIAARVAAKTVKEEDIHKKKLPEEKESRELIKRALDLIGDQSKTLRDEFQDFIKNNYEPKLADPRKRKNIIKGLKQRINVIEKFSKTPLKGSPADIAAKLAEIWPSGKPKNWATRAGILAAVRNAVNKLRIPASVKAKMLKDPGNAAKDASLVHDMLRDAQSGDITEDALTDQIELGGLISAYRVLLANPDTVTVDDLTREMDVETKRVHDEVQQILALPEFMKAWEGAMKGFVKGIRDVDTDLPEDTKSEEFYDDVQKSLKTFFAEDRHPVFEPDAFVEGLESLLGKEFDSVPDNMKDMLEELRGGARAAKGKAASYDALRSGTMGQRTATYHGVLQQGDPTHGPYQGYKSYDKRYFGKEHYDSIIKTAKQFLKEDWLKYEWEAGAEDANYRAALDLSIHLADSNLYQGKIDTETYNMLLGRLMGDKTDTFSETLITNEDSRNTRRASAMSNQHYQAILRVASGLRQENPRAALEIVKNLRMLIAQDQQEDQQDDQGGDAQGVPASVPKSGQQQQGQQQGQQCGPAPAPAVGQQQQQSQQQQGQQDQQGQQQQQSQISDKDMDAFVEGKVDIKDLKNHLKKTVDAKSIEDFVDGLMEMQDLLKKTASSRARVAQEQQQQGQQQQQQGQQEQTGAIEDLKLEALEDMDIEQQKAFLDKQKAEAQKLFNENDIEKFMEGFDALLTEAENAAKSVKTGSVVISMTSLVRLAHANPDARPVLLAMIREAAKKKQKKDKRKKDKAKKKGEKGKKPNPFAKGGDKDKGKGKGKKPPFGGKKAPPFGGKKAPPFGKKKSSVDIDPSDFNWG